MKVRPLSIQEAFGGFNHVIELTHADLTSTVTAGTPTQTIQAIALKAGDVIRDVAFGLQTAFQDTADAAYNSLSFTVGDDGSANRFLTATETNLNGTEITYKAGTQTAGYAYLVADTLDVIFTSTLGKALSALNVGKLYIWVNLVRLADAVASEAS